MAHTLQDALILVIGSSGKAMLAERSRIPTSSSRIC